MPNRLLALVLVALSLPAAGNEDFRGMINLAAYDRFVADVFPQVNRGLARQVVADYGINEGRVLEIALGAPWLSFELARATLLDFDVLVRDSAELELARRRADEQDLLPRFRFAIGRAEALPFDSCWFDIVLARDALRFWESKPAAFREINRVLRVGGSALLGGGLGRGWDARAAARLWARVQDWRNRTDPLPWAATSPYPEDLAAQMDSTGIPDFRVWTEGGYCNCRTWVEWTRLPALVEPQPAPETAAVGIPVPGFALAGLDGDTVRSESLRGRVVVLDFWGVDCRACLNMMGALRPLWDCLGPEACAVLAINIDPDPGLFSDFVAERGTLGYRMLWDHAGLARACGIQGLPHFVILDRSGIIRARVRGSTPATVAEIRRAVLKLLPED